MRQQITKVNHNVLWTGTERALSIDGQGNAATDFSTNFELARIPIPISGTFRNLTILTNYPFIGTLTLTLYKNNVATSLSVSIQQGEIRGTNSSDSVTVATNDDIHFIVTGNTIGFDGYPIAYSIEFEGIRQFYGLHSSWGTKNIGDFWQGGILGGGSTQDNSGIQSNFYSICSVSGAIKRLQLKAFNGPPGTGIWTGQLIKNSVIQDGSGGTINTTTVMTGTDESASTEFHLPIIPPDIVEVRVTRTGSNLPFSTVPLVGSSIAFIPDDGSSFMLTGGDNNAISGSDIGWRFNDNKQLETSEARSNSIIGKDGVIIRGIYTRFNSAPSPGDSWTITVRKNYTDTLITFSATNQTGLMLADVEYNHNDEITIELDPVSNPTNGGFHWGLAAFIPSFSGIYKLVDGQRYDKIYTNAELGTTVNKKIPNPFIRTALIGDE